MSGAWPRVFGDFGVSELVSYNSVTTVYHILVSFYMASVQNLLTIQSYHSFIMLKATLFIEKVKNCVQFKKNVEIITTTNY
jgi:hypothetical protein